MNNFLIYIISAYTYFLQGIGGIPDQAYFIYLKNTLHLSPQEIMKWGSIISLAWCIKPVFSFFVDKFGSKKVWILSSLISSVVCCLFLGTNSYPFLIGIGLMVLLSTTYAVRDISNDGMMCIFGKANQNTGALQGIQWGSLTVASIIVGLVGGEIAQRMSYQTGYLLLIPILLLGIIPLFFLKEVKKTNSPKVKDYLAVVKNKNFLLVGLFIFLFNFSPSFGTPLAFMQRDVFHWNERFIGYMGSLSSMFAVAGAIVYFYYSKKIDLKKWLYYSVFLGVLLTLSYLVYNPFTAIFYDCFFSFIGIIIKLIILDYVAKSSIEGLETTSFALLCSIINLASTCNGLVGGFLYPIVGLNWLIVLSALSSFICLPLLKRIKI